MFEALGDIAAAVARLTAANAKLVAVFANTLYRIADSDRAPEYVQLSGLDRFLEDDDDEGEDEEEEDDAEPESHTIGFRL